MSRSKVLSNTGWILLGSGFNKISSVILLIILSRYLGAEAFGKFSFPFFYLQFFSCIAEFGLTPVLIKHTSMNIIRPNEIQGRGIGLGLSTTVLAMIFAWVGTYMLGYKEDLRYLIVVASLGLLISFRDVTFRWILEVPFRAKLKMAYPVVLGIFSELLGLLMVLLAVYWKGSLESVLTVYVLSNLPGFIWLSIISTKELRPSLQAHSISVKEIIKEAVPIGMSNILMTIYLMFGSLVLFHYRGETDVGYYALAFRLTTSLRIIPEAMMHSLFPLLARVQLEDLSHVKEIFKSAVRYGAFIAFPLALGTMVVAPSVVILLGGEQFQPSATALSILIWATFFAFLNTALRFTFNAISMQKYNFYISILMAVVSIGLAFILIPGYGFIGASYTLVITEGVGLIYGLLISRSFALPFPVENFAKNLISALVMAVIISFMPYLFLQILLGSIIYIGINIFIRGISKDELLKLFPQKSSEKI